MSVHALLIGSRPDDLEPVDAVMDDVATYCGASSQLVVERCERRQDFVACVARVAASRLIDTLDIFDHGTYGTMWLGDGVLWQSDANASTPLLGVDWAVAIAPFLTPTAHVRLLGCDTAGAPVTSKAHHRRAGRLLVTKLARALGRRRIVFGTIRAVGLSMWSPDGFDAEVEESVLYSSLQAIDGDPPPWDVRLKQMVDRDVDPTAPRP